MSLQVWLPLNGNLKNYGLDGSVNALTCNSASYSDGKIGKCLHVTNYSTNNATFSSMKNATIWSFACWLKLDTSEISSSSYQKILTLNSNHDGNTGSIRIEHTATVGSFQIIINKAADHGSTTNTYYGANGSVTVAKDTWVHITVTNDGSKICTYYNGVLVSTKNVSNIYDVGYLTGGMYLGGSNYCHLNDVRIYDHCLSIKEIKEISKALILHYPLKSQYELGILNKYSGAVSDGKAISYETATTTITKLSDERGYNYKFNYTGSGSNKWFCFNFGHFTFTSGKKYYYSCKVRVNSLSNINSLSLRASRSSNDWVTNSTNVFSKTDGEWHEYYVYQTINDTYDRSGSTVTCNPTLEFYTGSLATSGTIYTADFDIKDIQVVESDVHIPFIDNDFSSTTVSDCSGYLNNGIISETLIYNNSSPRYDGSYTFNADSYIKIPKPISISNSSSFTISMWVNPTTECGDYSTIFSNYNSLGADGFWLAINTEGSGLWFYNGNYVKYSGSINTNLWNHVVMVFSSGSVTIYVNGVSKVTSDVSSRSVSFTTYIALGNSYTGTSWNTDFVGSISDVRVYSTALSEIDVKDLYNVPVSLDKSGNIYAYELKEV